MKVGTMVKYIGNIYDLRDMIGTIVSIGRTCYMVKYDRQVSMMGETKDIWACLKENIVTFNTSKRIS
jgi:hypothetical protein